MVTAEYTIAQDLISGARFLGIAMMGYAVFRLLLTLRSMHEGSLKVSGRLFIVACTVLGCQTLVQFMGHLRETHLALAWVVNLMSYVVVVPAFYLAVMNLMRNGKRIRLAVTCSVAVAVVSTILLLGGYGMRSTELGQTLPRVVSGLLMALEVLMTVWVMGDIRSLSKQSDKQTPRLKRSVHTTITIALSSLALPWIVMSPSLVLNALYGTWMYYLLFYLAIQYCNYSTEQEAASAIDHKPTSEPTTTQPSDSTVTEEMSRVEEIVQAWVASRAYTDPQVSIEQALQAMGIPNSTLYFYLECHSIHTFRNWISQLRIEEAQRQLIAHPHYSMDAIASLCGFSSGSSFTRAFNSHTGHSPSKWQEHHIGPDDNFSGMA